MADFKLAIPWVFQHEGVRTGATGWVNDPADPGGPTNWGVSLHYLQRLGTYGDFNHDGRVDIADIRAMTETDAQLVYLSGFWNPNMLTFLESQDVANKVMDTVVNVGSGAGIAIAQRSVNALGAGVAVDGGIGPQTVAALNRYAHAPLLMVNLCRFQWNYYRTLIEKNAALAKYGGGWRVRAQWPDTLTQLGWA